MSTLANGNGGLYSTTASTSSRWDRSGPSISPFNGGAVAWNQPVASSYMHGSNIVFVGPPQSPVNFVIPYISNRHHNPDGTRPPTLGGGNQGHNDAMHCPQLPASPSCTAPRNSSPHVSRDARSPSSIQRRAPRNDSPQESTNTLSDSGSRMLGKIPMNTGPPASASVPSTIDLELGSFSVLGRGGH
ncbi:hypothetical protein CDL15_Pgr007467 [Punica granatum]|uniref:Uncharacterized protein n=1 Tax=Punica granatum TaxID=22663 RepID=A0A218X9P1_PUNGR|nr:hypothetical protein CDL15_Pgr007467 [Punica granatum]